MKKTKKAFTLVEVLVVMSILMLTLAVVFSMTRSSAKIFQSGLLRFDYANQARQINLRLARDCAGPTYWQILDNFNAVTRRTGRASSGTCLVLAYTNTLDNLVPVAHRADGSASRVRITRMVCYYLDIPPGGITGAAEPHRALRRIDSAEPTPGVKWPYDFTSTEVVLGPNQSLADLLPTRDCAPAGRELARVHIGQCAPEKAPEIQLFYSQNSGSVSVNFLLRYGTATESFVAPFQLTSPILR